MIFIILIGLLTCYVFINVVKVAVRNRKAHKFFEVYAPKLPVLSNPGIFSGHLYKVVYTNKNWRTITEMHNKYGPSFGYYMCNQPWISTKDMDLLKLIELEEFNIHPDKSFLHLPFEEFNNSLFQSNGERWRRTRQAVGPGLRNQMIRSENVSADISYVTEQLRQSIESKLDKAKLETGRKSMIFDSDEIFHRYSTAVMFLVGYKQRDIVDFNAKVDYTVKVLHDGSRDVPNFFVGLAFMFNFLNPLLYFCLRFQKLGSFLKRVRQYMMKEIEIARKSFDSHKKARESNDEDEKFKRRMMDIMTDEVIKKNITYDEFMGNMVFMLLAGYVTTADSVSCLVWLLARHPEIQDKLRKAILEEGIDAEYVTWCLLENIRWHPPVPLNGGRILGRDITINGQFYPKGAYVVPSTNSIHKDPKIWPDPDEFKPERWANRKNFHPAAFMGFGLGPRNCPGYNLALHETRILMQMLLKDYRFETCAETPDDLDFSSPSMLYCIPDYPLTIKLTALSEAKAN